MKTNTKRILAASAAVVILATSAYAAGRAKTIEVLPDAVTVYVDDILVEPKDVNGNRVETFVYNGTTYLPLRAVAEALGQPVVYDGDTASAYIGKHEGRLNLLEVAPPFTKNYMDLKENINVGGKERPLALALAPVGSKIMYGSGFDQGYSTSGRSDGDGGLYAIFNLDGNYTELEFFLCQMDGQKSSNKGAKLEIYLDDVLVQTHDISSSATPQTVRVPLNYAKFMKFEVIDVQFQDIINFAVTDMYVK